jgi:STE24 endopeptidase
VLTLATLPLGAIARERSRNVGLVTQSWGGWARDVAKSTAIEAAMSAGGAVLLIATMRRFGPRWWLPASAGVVGIGALFLFAGPVVLDPVFNKFSPLAKGKLRSEVLDLAQRAGVSVGQVYEVDASKRTTAANAYVTGLGHTKRVVLYDTMIRDFTPAQTRLVVAHELGHVHYGDVPRGLLYLALVAPASLWAASLLGERFARRGGLAPASPAALPATVLAIGLVGLPVGAISNQLSRRVEARADSYALELTNEPKPYIEMERELALKNLSDPDPPGWITALLATHPPAIERIGTAIAFERR